MTIEEILKKDPNDLTMDDCMFILDNTSNGQEVKSIINNTSSSFSLKFCNLITQYKQECKEKMEEESRINEQNNLKKKRNKNISKILYSPEELLKMYNEESNKEWFEETYGLPQNIKLIKNHTGEYPLHVNDWVD